jgi:hypothetical protein
VPSDIVADSRERLAWQIVVSAGTLAAVLAARREVFDAAAPFAPFSAQAPGGLVLLALRVALFGASALALLDTAPRRRLPYAVLSASFVASLAWKALVLPFAVGCLVLLLRRRELPSWPWTPRARQAALLALVLGLVLFAMSEALPDPTPPPPDDPRALAASWQARGNPYRARFLSELAAKPRPAAP